MGRRIIKTTKPINSKQSDIQNTINIAKKERDLLSLFIKEQKDLIKSNEKLISTSNKNIQTLGGDIKQKEIEYKKSCDSYNNILYKESISINNLDTLQTKIDNLKDKYSLLKTKSIKDYKIQVSQEAKNIQILKEDYSSLLEDKKQLLLEEEQSQEQLRQIDTIYTNLTKKIVTLKDNITNLEGQIGDNLNTNNDLLNTKDKLDSDIKLSSDEFQLLNLKLINIKNDIELSNKELKIKKTELFNIKEKNLSLIKKEERLNDLEAKINTLYKKAGITL